MGRFRPAAASMSLEAEPVPPQRAHGRLVTSSAITPLPRHSGHGTVAFSGSLGEDLGSPWVSSFSFFFL